jgi:hypothetical protein
VLRYCAALWIGLILGCWQAREMLNTTSAFTQCDPVTLSRIQTGCSVDATSVCVHDGCFARRRRFISSLDTLSNGQPVWVRVGNYTLTAPVGIYCLYRHGLLEHQKFDGQQGE